MTKSAIVATIAALLAANSSAFGVSHRYMRASPVARRSSRENLTMRWGLKGNSANKITGDIPDGKTLRDTVPFEIRGFSLPLVVFSIGALLTAWSVFGYVINQDGSGDGSLSSLGFVYGIPVFLIGLSLWYAEIPPVQVESSQAGDRAFEKFATENLRKIKQDVTRHRYGDDAHLDTSLEALGLKLPQKKFPRFQKIIQEEAPNGQLVFTMVFESLETPYKVWSDPERVARYARFFGPDVTAEVIKVDSAKRLVAIKLTTITSDGSAEPQPVVPAAQPFVETVTSGVSEGDDF